MAVLTRSRFKGSPMTTIGASGKLAFAALMAFVTFAVSRTPIRTSTCSPALAIVLGTSSVLEVAHAGLNGLFAKMVLRPSRARRLGWTTTHTTDTTDYSPHWLVSIRHFQASRPLHRSAGSSGEHHHTRFRDNRFAYGGPRHDRQQ